ncbi:hypothetical protein K7432_018531 [Basidiobolus ranarum]|uniref:Uncharacterized protein n=1 Tax=Basidiobolus ranarum TaxID=34480 RepID=A0ABR2VIY8_9FUNG
MLKKFTRINSDGHCLGEFYFSDVYADRPVPEEVRQHPILVGECLGGALEIENVGFVDTRMLSKSPIEVVDQELLTLVGDVKFYSITYRLFKISTLKQARKYQGHTATYLGTIPGHPEGYLLDACTYLLKDQPISVSVNSAEILSKTWSKLSKILPKQQRLFPYPF